MIPAHCMSRSIGVLFKAWNKKRNNRTAAAIRALLGRKNMLMSAETMPAIKGRNFISTSKGFMPGGMRVFASRKIMSIQNESRRSVVPGRMSKRSREECS